MIVVPVGRGLLPRIIQCNSFHFLRNPGSREPSSPPVGSPGPACAGFHQARLSGRRGCAWWARSRRSCLRARPSSGRAGPVGLRPPGSAHPRALGGAPASWRAGPGRRGGGQGRRASLSARASLRTRLTRLPFVVCTGVERVRARVRECARGQRGGGGGREAGRLFLQGWLARPGLGGQWGLADTRLPGRGPWRSPGPFPPARWQTL